MVRIVTVADMLSALHYSPRTDEDIRMEAQRGKVSDPRSHSLTVLWLGLQPSLTPELCLRTSVLPASMPRHLWV